MSYAGEYHEGDGLRAAERKITRLERELDASQFALYRARRFLQATLHDGDGEDMAGVWAEIVKFLGEAPGNPYNVVGPLDGDGDIP